MKKALEILWTILILLWIVWLAVVIRNTIL